MFDEIECGSGDRLAAEDALAYEISRLPSVDEPDRHLLPEGLEDIPPGPFLAAIVSSVQAPDSTDTTPSV